MPKMEALKEKDGMYDEKENTLEEVKFGANQKGRYMKLIDEEGNEYTTVDKRVHWRTFRFLDNFVEDATPDDMRTMSVGELSEVLTQAAKERGEEFKFLTLGDEFINLVSKQHKQIPWSDVREAVKEAVIEVSGEEPEIEEWSPKNINYGLPVDNEYIDGYLATDLGSNSGIGRASILTFPRTKVIHNVFGEHGPCLNWSRAWIKVDRVANFNMRGKTTGQTLGLEDLRTRDIHTKEQDITPDSFTNIVDDFISGINKAEEGIEEAINEEMSKKEMVEALYVYHNNGVIPKYVIPMIMNRVQAQTVWGFANAITRVRTHATEDFRTRKGDPFHSDLANKLEKMSAEIQSIIPGIKELHNRGITISQELLTDPPEEFSVEEDERKVIEITDEDDIELLGEQ